MNHETITNLLTSLKRCGIADNTVEAFTNIIKDQGYQEPNKYRPMRVEDVVQGIYSRNNNRNDYDSLIHVRYNPSKACLQYCYLHNTKKHDKLGDNYFDLDTSYLQNEYWELVFQF